MRCLGRTETDRKITNEPWSSKQSLTEQRRPLFGVKGVVCPKKEKREQKLIKKVLTRAGIVRDIAYEPSAPLIPPLNWTEVGRKINFKPFEFFDQTGGGDAWRISSQMMHKTALLGTCRQGFPVQMEEINWRSVAKNY